MSPLDPSSGSSTYVMMGTVSSWVTEAMGVSIARYYAEPKIFMIPSISTSAKKTNCYLFPRKELNSTAPMANKLTFWAVENLNCSEFSVPVYPVGFEKPWYFLLANIDTLSCGAAGSETKGVPELKVLKLKKVLQLEKIDLLRFSETRNLLQAHSWAFSK